MASAAGADITLALKRCIGDTYKLIFDDERDWHDYQLLLARHPDTILTLENYTTCVAFYSLIVKYVLLNN